MERFKDTEETFSTTMHISKGKLKTTLQVEWEYFRAKKKDLSMKVSGKMICHGDWESRFGMTGLFMKGCL